MHIAVIMDGNGRWANSKGKARLFGHRNGEKAAKRCVKAALKNNIKTLSLFAFSTENWSRGEAEVDGLMNLFLKAIYKNEQLFHKNQIRFYSIGDRSQFSQSLSNAICELEEKTKNYDKLNLVIVANYGGRWDIQNAYLEAQKNKSPTIEPYLALNQLGAEFCEVDLMIRTGGEKRISNFLLWNLAYSELYFCNTLWPDFNENHFLDALNFFNSRKRRFGTI